MVMWFTIQRELVVAAIRKYSLLLFRIRRLVLGLSVTGDERGSRYHSAWPHAECGAKQLVR